MKLLLFVPVLIFFILIAKAQEKMVSVNGKQYHVIITGLEKRKANSPVVVLESGMAVNIANWKAIPTEISAFAPVLAYERAGIGRSEKQYTMPTPTFVAQNLHAILEELKISPPYILVGHSLGGVYIRAFAGIYPTEVVGLAFIDPADFTETRDDWNNIFRKLGLSEERIQAMIKARLYGPAQKTDSVNFGPWSERQVLAQLRRDDFAQITALPLPKVPIYFFVGGKFEVPLNQRSREYDQEKFFHIKNSSNMERWRKLIYATGKHGAMLYLTGAGHYIHWDEPISVVENLKILFNSSLK